MSNDNRSMLAAVAAAMNLPDEAEEAEVAPVVASPRAGTSRRATAYAAPVFAPAVQVAAPLTADSLRRTISQEWSGNAALAREFSSFAAYQAWRERQICKARGTTIEEVRKAEPDVAAYVAMVEARNGALSGEARSAIEGYATTWRESSDIRAEFGSFAAFASYQRAAASGLIRRCGKL